mmetsp:Transcript_51732/g.103666  ORF Transcript_51732/g.103666 Transcript_51732/m.103666 type:complete len:128 (-) Transcript_51732:64-447(-)
MLRNAPRDAANSPNPTITFQFGPSSASSSCSGLFLAGSEDSCRVCTIDIETGSFVPVPALGRMVTGTQCGIRRKPAPCLKLCPEAVRRAVRVAFEERERAIARHRQAIVQKDLTRDASSQKLEALFE